MNFFPVAHVLFLVTIANGSPLLAKWLMWDTLSGPVDRDLRFTDGRPVFGRSKTIRRLLVVVWSRTLMVHSYCTNQRMRYGPGSSRERHDD